MIGTGDKVNWATGRPHIPAGLDRALETILDRVVVDGRLVLVVVLVVG